MIHPLTHIARHTMRAFRFAATPLALVIFATSLAAPAGAQDGPVALVSKGRVMARIVIADRPDHISILHPRGQSLIDGTHTTRYAAEFLQSYIKLSTGVEIPIIDVKEAKYQNRPLILVGRSELTDFVEEDRAKLDPEGYIVRRHGNNVAIVGEFSGDGDDVMLEQRNLDRGTLFGVYAFLEEVVGVRFYFPGRLGVIVPKRDTLMMSSNIDLTDAPAFVMRTGGVHDLFPSDGEISREDELLGLAHPVGRFGNTTGFNTNHSSNDWHRYVKDHIEVFAVDKDGVPQVYADGYGGHNVNHLNYLHPKTLEIDIQRVQDFYERGIRYWSPEIAPNSRYVRFFPRDIENVYHDRSPESQALWTPDRGNSMLSEIIHGYAARFAAEIKKLYPEKRLAFGAYAGFLLPPLSVEFPDNADVMIATLKGGSLLVSQGHWHHNTDLIKQWYDALGQDKTRLYLWEYFTYPNHRIAFYPHIMQRWYQFCEQHVSGGFNNTYSQRREDHADALRLTYINAWFRARLMWNPDMDVDAALQQMYADLFGPAEQPMGDLIDLCIDAYENAPWRPGINPGAVSYVQPRFLFREVFGPDFAKKARTLLADARQAVPDDSIFAERIEFFGQAIEAELDDAEAFHANDKKPPQARVPHSETTDLQAMLRKIPQGVSALELRGRTLGSDPGTLSPSQVYVTRNADNLLITARLSLREPRAPRSRGEFRDDPRIHSDDHFAVDVGLRDMDGMQLDFYYRIIVNPAGHIADGLVMVPIVMASRHWNTWIELWNPNDIEVATAVGEDGWNVAMRLPLNSFPEFAKQPRNTIRVQFSQRLNSRARLEPTLTWSPMFVSPSDYDISRMGTLILN